MALPRMRTAQGAYDEIRKADPHTEVTQYYIRTLIKSGAVPHVDAGRKKLVNLDTLMDYLSDPTPVEPITTTFGGIRRIAE